MTVYELIELLGDIENKEMQVLVSFNDGWMGMCGIDSGELEIDGEQFLCIAPCFGHGDEQLSITRELKADDFEEPPQN